MPKVEVIAPTKLPNWLTAPWERVQENARIDRLGHAVLLSGPKGVGKQILAEHIRKLALCGKRSVPACGNCRSCEVAAAGNHADDHAVVLPEDKKNISVDQIRHLISKLGLSPSYENRKFALVYPAEAMTNAAANALLKTLEEPPGDTLLVLVSHNVSTLPATVMSRCQVIQCGAPEHSEGRAWLTESAGTTKGDVCLMLAGGAPFQALKYYEQGVEEVYSSVIEDISRLRNDASDLVAVASGWSDVHLDVRLLSLYAVLKQLVLEALDLDGELAHKSELKSLRMKEGQIKLSSLLGYQDAVVRARASLDGPLNQQLMLEKLLAPWSNGFRTQGLEYRNP
ncbi:MAG: hypothetical protein AB8G18_05575 [Gammaproteobacteria bacterium]